MSRSALTAWAGAARRLSATEIAARLAGDAVGRSAAPILEFPALAQMLPAAPRPAAVLVPLLIQDGEWRILYTRRNAGLPEHSGQVSFPGGRADPDDPGPQRTALREAFEEVALDPADVRVLGQLGAYRTITNYLVTPIVGVMP